MKKNRIPSLLAGAVLSMMIGNHSLNVLAEAAETGASPVTGDKSNPWMIIVFVAAAAAILGILFFMKKKE